MRGVLDFLRISPLYLLICSMGHGDWTEYVVLKIAVILLSWGDENWVQDSQDFRRQDSGEKGTNEKWI